MSSWLTLSSGSHGAPPAIQSAQVNSRRLPDGAQQAVDLFWVRAVENAAQMESRLAKLKRDLAAVIDGEIAPLALVKPKERPSWSVRATPPVLEAR